MLATGCLACFGFDSLHVVHCPSLFKGEKGKWVSPATFHIFPLQNTMIVIFLVKSVHSWDLDWHDQFSYLRHWNPPKCWKHLATLGIQNFKNPFPAQFSQVSHIFYFRFSASCAQFAKYLISATRAREGTVLKIGCNDTLPWIPEDHRRKQWNSWCRFRMSQ